MTKYFELAQKNTEAFDEFDLIDDQIVEIYAKMLT